MAVNLIDQNETVRMPLGQLGEVLCRCWEAKQPAPVALLPVTCPATLGDYELLAEVGRGAAGIVYKARQVRLNRIVALKMLRPEALQCHGAVERLEKEAEVAAQLDHPGIIPIHDVGQHDGHPYICMAFVDGENLAARLKRGPMGAAAAARVVAEVAEAVQHAHDNGIIHHDLKPANIVLDRSGQPRIADFGLARRIGEGEQPLTAGISGTPAYMSPEQAAGQTNVVGPASDVYALGALLYHLLTGRPPFDGPDAAAVIRQVREDEPPAPRSLEASIPRALEGICLRCLQKAACARWASARDLARELHQFVSSRPKDAADARFSPGLESQLDVGACRTLHGRRRSLFLAGLLR